MKKAIALLLAGAMAFTVAACGNKAGNSQTVSTQSKEAQTAADSNEEAGKPSFVLWQGIHPVCRYPAIR